jgi:hypothetical protein
MTVVLAEADLQRWCLLICGTFSAGIAGEQENVSHGCLSLPTPSHQRVLASASDREIAASFAATRQQ